MSSHPNPGNRTEYINKEAGAAHHREPRRRREFEPVKAAFAVVAAARRSMSDWPGRATAPAAKPRASRSARPDSRCRVRRRSIETISGGKVFQADRAGELDEPAVEQRDQGRSAKRVRSTERPDGLQPRRRVRHRRSPDRAICRRRRTPGSKRSRRTIPSSASPARSSRSDLAAFGASRRRSSIRRRLAARSASTSTPRSWRMERSSITSQSYRRTRSGRSRKHFSGSANRSDCRKCVERRPRVNGHASYNGVSSMAR